MSVTQNYLFSPTGQALNAQVNSAFVDLISQINTADDGKANLALSNLAAVAINTSLLAGVNNTIDLGSSSFTFKSAYLKTSLILQQTGAGTNAITIAPPTSITSHTLTLPSAQGGASTYLKNDGSGGLSWATITAGATTALDNLASVAINLALLPGTDNSIDLGSTSKRWVNLYVRDIDAGASGTAGSLDLFPSTASKGKLSLSAADSGGNFTTTVTNASQAAARTYTIPDAGASASFVMTEGTQTINGAKSFAGTLTVDGQLIGKGTATNDSAATGYIGEYVESNITTNTNFPTSNQYGDLTSISLTAGDWDVTIAGFATLNGSTTTTFEFGISTTSGNSTTGLTYGVNRFDSFPPTAAADSNVGIPSYRVKLTTTTTVYFKYRATYSLGTPQAAGTIHARRVR